MQNLRCLVIDDETPAIRLLESYIKKVPFLELVGSSTDPIQAIAIIEKEDLDLIFLDIQMPTLTGIQLSKIVKDKVHIIFTTAYPQFALESYELNATDYLLKPFDFDRFYQAIQKVKPQTMRSVKTEQSQSIFVKTDGKNNFERIEIGEILYVESLRNYVCIHLAEKQIITYNTLKHFVEELPQDQFAKVHKSFVVAINKIKRTDTLSVEVSNGKSLPIGETYKKQFFELINKRIL